MTRWQLNNHSQVHLFADDKLTLPLESNGKASVRRKGRETRIAALPRMYRERLTARGTAYAPHATANAYGESHGNPEWFLTGRS